MADARPNREGDQGDTALVRTVVTESQWLARQSQAFSPSNTRGAAPTSHIS
jgi:hypothetical protein